VQVTHDIKCASLQFFLNPLSPPPPPPPACSGDVDRSVRASASQLLLLLVRRCGKAIAPHLKVSAHVHRQVVPLTLMSSGCALHCGWRAATLHSKRSRFVLWLPLLWCATYAQLSALRQQQKPGPPPFPPKKSNRLLPLLSAWNCSLACATQHASLPLLLWNAVCAKNLSRKNSSSAVRFTLAACSARHPLFIS
jgi:hypothetical protein